MTRPLVVIDADVLGRRRTGDETYVSNLLELLPSAAPELRFAAVTRRVDLVPPEVEAVELPARSQELRMLWSLPRLLARLSPALAHFQHAMPVRCPCPAVVTVHDLSFEHAPLMSARHRLIFRAVVPRATRRAARVLTVSERTKADLVRMYAIPQAKVTVTHLGVDGDFRPGERQGEYALFVGAVERRKNPLAAARAASGAGIALIVAGPVKDERLAAQLRATGADLRGYVTKTELVELYRHAGCLVLPSHHEGFGLPVLEAMACGTPVVATPEPALLEVADGAAIFAPLDRLADAIRQALADSDRLGAAGIERAKAFTWEETVRRTADVYRELVLDR